jgi:hypothetical protein
MSAAPSAAETCARCRCPVAAWRVEVAGAVYCTAYCARASHPPEAPRLKPNSDR